MLRCLQVIILWRFSVFKKITMIICLIVVLIASLEAKTILVSGASGDIGLAVVKKLLQEKHKVICHYANNKDNLKKLEEQYPGKVFLLQADFNDLNLIKDFWKSALKFCGKIDIIINAAGVVKEDTSLQEIQMIMNINYLSPRLLCDYAIKYFKYNKVNGIIINLGGRAAYRGMPEGYYTHASSKAALIRYSQDIAKHNAPYGIYVYTVAPGPVATKAYENMKPEVKKQSLDSMPTKTVVGVHEIADMISFLASGKVPNATGGVFDLMGASWTH